ncbi:3-oxoadipyl-CoA thiolase [Desulfovibrio sp. OttesenSCG-928-O18]|nr:3-oxoadipyl-CoA thiolase [Desulfovibrio sp. OttesenSCG-928-O18]
MREVFLCEYIRTPIGRYGGMLSSVRTDDLAAVPMRALRERLPEVDWTAVDDVIYGCVNQAGEDNRNVARMALLLAGFHESVSGFTVNRLCGSGMTAVGMGMQAIATGQAELIVTGGVEGMSRTPFVIPKAETAFSRHAEIHDTTIGYRFINPVLHEQYGTESMPQTADNVAKDYAISREDQDLFALRSQEKAAKAQAAGIFAEEICPVSVKRKKETFNVDTDEHPRATSLEALAALRPLFPGGTVTAGNASGVNDGAAALLLASKEAVARYALKPLAQVMGVASAGVPPRVMGIGPVPATQKVLRLLGLQMADMDVIELNEAFASQGLAVLRQLGVKDDDARVNPYGGAIALGHPLGMSGARLVGTAAKELHRTGKQYALCTMCIGVGQGIAMVLKGV